MRIFPAVILSCLMLSSCGTMLVMTPVKDAVVMIDEDTARIQDAEETLRNFKPEEALAILDQALEDFDESQQEDSTDDTAEDDSATDDFNRLTQRMMLTIIQEETRFFAMLATEKENLDALTAIYDPGNSDKTEKRNEMFERFFGDGTTGDAKACYQLFAISGHSAMAERSFQRMLKLNENEPHKVFRLRVLKASTLMGLAEPEGQLEYARASKLLDSNESETVGELDKYRTFMLLPALAMARQSDFAGALETVRKQLRKDLSKITEEGLQRYEKTFSELAEVWPTEREAWKAEAEDLPKVEMITDQGRIEITLFEDDAPNTVASFITLVESGFYDGLKFHRVVPHFVVQGGDPDGTGEGGPGYAIKLEATRHHFRGSLSMARSEHPDSAGSQFFFCLSAATTHHLNDSYAVFGRVSEGLDVMDKLRLGGTIKTAKVVSKRDREYIVEKLPEEE